MTILKRLLVIIAASLCIAPLSGQIRLGVMGGLSTSDIPANDLIILDQDGLETFKLSAEQADYGFHFGLFLRGEIGKFYLEPSLIFNSNNIHYRIEDLNGDQTFSLVKNETYQYLDLPLIMGFKFGFLRLGAGPVGHVFIDSSSELFDIGGYRQKFEQTTWGWQANVGLDIWFIRLDLKYEGNFTRYGDHFEFFGQSYRFSDRPTRLIASVGITF